jgi:ribosome maturation factor RimP
VNAKLPFSDEIAERIRALLSERGIELCHIDWNEGKRRGLLSMTIDREGGVTLDDCEKATRAVEEFLDALPELDRAYTLEVASPGLDRVLYSLDDCRRFRGRRVRLQLQRRVEGAARMKGTLESVDGNALTILDEDQKRRYTVRFDEVKVARLVPEL